MNLDTFSKRKNICVKCLRFRLRQSLGKASDCHHRLTLSTDQMNRTKWFLLALLSRCPPARTHGLSVQSTGMGDSRYGKKSFSNVIGTFLARQNPIVYSKKIIKNHYLIQTSKGEFALIIDGIVAALHQCPCPCSHITIGFWTEPMRDDTTRRAAANAKYRRLILFGMKDGWCSKSPQFKAYHENHGK